MTIQTPYGPPFGKGGRQPWQPGGCPWIEQTGQLRTEISPAGLKAFAPFKWGNQAHFLVPRLTLKRIIAHANENPVPKVTFHSAALWL